MSVQRWPEFLRSSRLRRSPARRIRASAAGAGFRIRLDPERNDWAELAAGGREILAPPQFAEFDAQLTALRHAIAGRTELPRLLAAWRKRTAE